MNPAADFMGKHDPASHASSDSAEHRPQPGGTLASSMAGGLRWTVRPDLVGAGHQPLLEAPDSFLADPAQQLSHSSLITMSLVGSSGGAPLLLRRLNYGRLRHRLRDVFRPTRAERAFRHGLGMELAGVPTPRVLAVGVERILRWPVRAYLLMEFVPGAKTLRQLLADQGGLTLAQARQIAGIMARLHNAGFSHRDLNASNVLYSARMEPCFIDLDGVRRHARLSRARAVSNLARLAREFIPKGLARVAPWFLRHYCQQRGLRGEVRSLYKEAMRELAPFLDAPR